jgi:Electron transfer DM13
LAYLWFNFGVSSRLVGNISPILHPADKNFRYENTFDAMKNFKKIFPLTLLMLFVIFASVLLTRFVSTSETLAYGCFHQVAHKGAGCAVIVRKSDGRVFLQLTNFKTAVSDDLHILLISAPDAAENETVKNSSKIYVAPLAKNEGFQEYAVPRGNENLSDFHSVTIWNAKHAVNFTTAPLKHF